REPITLAVQMSAGADERAIQKIARIELDARLSRPDFQHPTGFWLIHPRRQHHHAVFRVFTIEYKIMIVASTQHNLLMGRTLTGADDFRQAEVKRCAFDLSQFARWNKRLIDG